MPFAPRSKPVSLSAQISASESHHPKAKSTVLPCPQHSNNQRSNSPYQSQDSLPLPMTMPIANPVTNLVTAPALMQLTDQLISASSHVVSPHASTFTKANNTIPKNINGRNDHAKISSEHLQLSLLKTALDSFFDSILVIHADGRILQANGQVNRLFANAIPQELTPSTTRAYESSLEPQMQHPLQPLLDEVKRVATAMMDSQNNFPDQDIVLDSEVEWDGEAFRLRVRWMDLTIEHQPCLLVTIEDLQQTAINQVNVDRWKYKLTPREAEVWRLRRQGYSYKAIASTLFVSENTVKKHLKNIQVKRREKDGVDIG